MDASGKPLKSRQLIERLGGHLGNAAVAATGAGAPRSFLARRQGRNRQIGDYARSLLGGRYRRGATSRLRREDAGMEELRQRAPYRTVPQRPVGDESAPAPPAAQPPRRRYDPYQ